MGEETQDQHPLPDETGEEEAQASPTQIIDDGDGTASRGRRPKRDPNAKPTPRHKMKSLSLQVPEYLDKELKLRAIKHNTTVRYLIMKALRGANFTIHDADMVEDGRRNR